MDVPTDTEHLRIANGLFAARHWGDAEHHYNAALALKPQNAVALHNMAATRLNRETNEDTLAGLILLRAACHTLAGNEQYWADFILAAASHRSAKLALGLFRQLPGRFKRQSNFKSLQSRLQTASTTNPARIRPRTNSDAVEQLISQSKLGEALDTLLLALEDKPRDAHRWQEFGGICLRAGHPRLADAAYRASVGVAPINAKAFVGLSNSLIQQGHLEQAVTVLEGACASLPDNPGLIATLVHAQVGNGRVADALETARAAKASFGDDNTQLAMVEAYALSFSKSPDGAAATAIGAVEASLNPPSFRQALAIISRIGTLAELKALLDLAARAEVSLNDRASILLQVRVYLNEKRWDDAITVARTSFDPREEDDQNNAHLAMCLAKALDAQGDYEEAQKMLDAGNGAIAKHAESANNIAPNGYLDRLKLLRHELKRTPIDRTQLDCERVPAQFVFMVGFPRSGTTLLDSILRSHDSIEIAEEAPTLRNTIINAFRDLHPERITGDWNELNRAFFQTDPAHLRKLYSKEFARQLGATIKPGKFYVDKLPLNLAHAQHIAHMFPTAHFVFSLRDPADCVFSCYQQDFALNDAMFQFTSLHRAAHTYDLAMKLWFDAVDTLKIEPTMVRYESLIEDLRTEVHPVLDALGLDWQDSMEKFHETARKRKFINTPSANQVREKLYTTSVAKWRRYADEESSWVQTLEPWRRRFGYA